VYTERTNRLLPLVIVTVALAEAVGSAALGRSLTVFGDGTLPEPFIEPGRGHRPEGRLPLRYRWTFLSPVYWKSH